MFKSYAGAIGLGIVTVLVFPFVLSPLLDPMVGQIDGKTISQPEWMAEFTKWGMISAGVCTLSLLAWLWLSSNRYPIDPSGIRTQMPYWILHALPPLAVALAGYFLLPTVGEGWLEALLVILIPILLQFWLTSIFFSPNPRSVLLGSLVRRK